MTTFCDALDYCEVWGHDVIEGDFRVRDIIGTQERIDKCKRCGKQKYVTKERESRIYNFSFPRDWH